MKRKYLLNIHKLAISLLILLSITLFNSAFALPSMAYAKSSVKLKKVSADISVSGKVTDDDGSPLAGVTVKVKGTTLATGTAIDGTYRISVPNESAVLVYSFVGYASKEVVVGGKSTINVQLVSDNKSLTEVVVVGYGTQKRANVTGAVSSVSGKDLAVLPVGGVDQALQGRVAGLTVTNNGSPGSAPIVQIRGVSSIGYGADPLYIIDGFPGSIGGLDPRTYSRLTCSRMQAPQRSTVPGQLTALSSSQPIEVRVVRFS